MNVTPRPAASFVAIERFDPETLALLDELDVEIPEFGGVDLDVVFGTPLEMYEAGELPHERLVGLDDDAALTAIRDRHDRLLAASDIAADDPSITARIRERLVDVLLPYAEQLRTTPSVAAPLPIAA
ncbi:hypothetical protein [Streptomyces sp. NPDC059788]|uniref:hypothetical protein n=1 Tax=Streptomyces sp. NPDC059788 TaxID=3346948 RepID=UPI003661AF3E